MTRPIPLRCISRWRWLGAFLGVCVSIVSQPAQATPGLHHDLAVRLEPATRQLVVEDTIAVQGTTIIDFTLASRFAVERVLLDGVAVAVVPQPAQGHRNRWRVPLDSSPRPRTLRVRYQGRLEPLPAADHRDVLRGLPPMADLRGSFLPGGTGWYPEIGSAPFTYQVSLDVPAGQRGLVPGRLVGERTDGGRYRATFEFTHPAEAIDLIAGPYQIREDVRARAQGPPLRLRTYFHPEITDLAPEYLAATGRYIEHYSRRIGEYPYTEFSVISSPLPTGFGMPALTYLGIDVLRLPFIRETSLRHEILHNWWGNGVYVDWEHGNWSEGLTTFLADYAAKEETSDDTAREMRLAWLRDLAAVPPGEDTPVRQFMARHHGTSQIVGYHKSAFLFFMLRDRIGQPAFDEGLRRFYREWQFRRAGWTELQRAFEAAADHNLAAFFGEWLGRRGTPAVRIEQAKVERAGATSRLRLALAQDEPAYDLRVPVVVTTMTGATPRIVELRQRREEFILDVDAQPRSVTLDPDYRLLRRLELREAPPILRDVIVNPATVIVILGEDPGHVTAGHELARQLLDHPPRAGDPEALPASGPLLVIGHPKIIDDFLGRHRLPARPDLLRDRGTAQVWTARDAGGRTLVVVSAESTAALRALLRPLPHYGRQSYLVFQGAKVTDRGVWPAQPHTWRVADEAH
jgi:aminopeptidase N